MKGQTAVVSGGAQGIGLATVELLARQGYTVIALDLNPAVVEVAAALADEGLPVEGRVANMTERESIRGSIADLAAIHVVVCAAGILRPKPIDQQTDEDFALTFDVNVYGVFRLAQEALARIPEGGRIVMLASRGVLGGRNNVAYASSKAAVVGMVRSMAMDLRERLITVNAVAPGFTDTPMIQAFGEEGIKAASALEARGRPAKPSEIAPAIAFLASPDASFITGQTLFVDGGKSLGGLAGAV
ncbi:MAG: SDR family NAD(P)-dependent oxidoreductase [Candidatus Andeanibacterium colombiense]|uniref:SDR family NAD(P)-dependent oxidoreductase n=1 Tax=Candidatus Andeanibacterium colombiense TaxID=3121345 RepID=A0AAJ5X4G9_9SPHN|nr:MAG: SDR family NAD(P)-dependent oxidoreductase [Sphingomonadaceae bacterium]